MTIYHGEDTLKSRNAFLQMKSQLKQSGLQVESSDGDNLTLAHLTIAVESTSLFGIRNAVFIDNFFSRRPSNEKKLIVEYLSGHQDAEIYLWDGKDISSQCTAFTPDRCRNFQLPKHIFTFLDTLSVASYRLCLQSLPAEQLYASLITRLHKVIVGEGRFKRTFPPEQLTVMASELLDLEYKFKTGVLPYDFATALELWLIKLNTV